MTKLWQASALQIEQSNIYGFMQFLKQSRGLIFDDYDSLYQWSVDSPQSFWESFWYFINIKHSARCHTVLQQPTGMFMARWFSGARLNFAENMLRSKSKRHALEFYNEQGASEHLSYNQLYLQVAQLASALRSHGVKKGDRIAAVVPNIAQAVIAALASASLGAVWSSCSPEFGLQSMLDRFKQIKPRVLIYADGYYYKGQAHPRLEVIKQLRSRLSSVGLSIAIPYIEATLTPEPGVVCYGDFLDKSATRIQFEQCHFSDPLYILFSSGTTGVPKCIVHGVGGTLIQHLKELSLHIDIKTSDKLFYYTSTGWMMWNWMLSGLGLGATLVLYDGNPLYPDAGALFKLLAQHRVTVFGCSAKYISSLQKARFKSEGLDLSSLRLILSTGSPLLAEQFDYVYQSIKPEVQLGSISGGTDIISCFALANPLKPVYRGELQSAGLGMNIRVYDEQGHALHQQKGELVCVSAFPSMPVGFWNDKGNILYHQAYFEKYINVWAHGDYAEITEHNGLIIYGRSDATLNPGGVRIGTAEIYRQLETMQEVDDCIAVAQQWQGDQRIVLFVQLRNDLVLDEALIEKIKQRIKANASVHHVPDIVLQVNDIPKTYSGKIAEIAVTRIIHNQDIGNESALINPESLQQFQQFEVLKHG